MEEKLSFTLNGKKTEVLIDTSRTLLWVLRNHFGLTGTKYGCGTGFCGACTVLIDDEPFRSCMLPVADVAGKRVVTIEGLEKMAVSIRFRRHLLNTTHFSADSVPRA